MDMERQKLTTFFKLCRLCLMDPGMVDIFETEGLIEDIYTCTSVKVFKDGEQLPRKICTKCSEIIHSAKSLKVIAKKNDTHLRSLYSDHNEINEPTVEPTDTIERNYISVRTDIFESSAVVSSSTRIKLEEDLSPNNSQCKWKKRKICKEDDDELIEYECSLCEKKFETWKKLYLHNRLHYKNIPCPIDACGKKFATKGDVEKHIRIHTGDKPYQCEVCGKAFAQRGTLKSHREVVHDSNTKEHIKDE